MQEKSATKQAGRFCSGALILAISGLLVKLLGMVYKIPLTNLLKDEGMGYFNAAYTVYTLFFVIATSGLPVALSLLVSESLAKGEHERAGQIYRTASRLFLWVGIAFFLLMALPARGFAALLGNEKAAAGILAVSPALAFMTYASVLRGYFQGFRHMTPLAVSQVVEAAGRFLLGIAFALFALSRFALSTVSAYAILGLTFATFFSLIFLLIAKRRFDKREGYAAARCQLPSRETQKADRWRILKIAFPVTVGSSVTTLASSLDLFLIMRVLQSIGYSAEEANAMWGNYSALAVPLFNMPTVLILPIAYSVSPFVRGALAKKDHAGAKQATCRALMLTSCLAIPASLGLSLLSKPVLSLLYSDPVSVEKAAPLLSLLALAVFPLALLSVTSSLLQAYGKLWFPIASVGVGILVKLIVTLWGIPRFGLSATPVGTFVCYSVVCALNLAALCRAAGGFSVAKLLVKPFAAAIPTAFVASFSYRLLSRTLPYEKLATLLAILLAVLVFVLALALVKAISKEDALSLGLSEKWVARLEKLHFLS